MCFQSAYDIVAVESHLRGGYAPIYPPLPWLLQGVAEGYVQRIYGVHILRVGVVYLTYTRDRITIK